MPQHTHLHEGAQLAAECSVICTQTALNCLKLGGHHAAPDHQTLLLDCADICAAASRFMARNSPHHPHVCRECAEICTQCADDCEHMAGDDPLMKRCAEICRRCAESCAQMAAARVE